MLVREKRVLEEKTTKKCGCVSKSHRENHMEFGKGGPAVLQKFCYISSLYQARRILRAAVD